MIVQLITDGSCLGNPGRGGWACILKAGTVEKVLTGHEVDTTNNRMELLAAIKGLEALNRPNVEVEVITDSQYLRLGITEWIKKWKGNGWRTSDRKPVLNKDLWMELDVLASRHRVTWTWTKGHAGHPDQERCDSLAQAAARIVI